jgi:hypothetical protein
MCRSRNWRTFSAMRSAACSCLTASFWKGGTGSTSRRNSRIPSRRWKACSRLLHKCRRSARGSRATAEIRKPSGAFWTGDRERWWGSTPCIRRVAERGRPVACSTRSARRSRSGYSWWWRWTAAFSPKARSPNGALWLTARLERLTDLPPALVGSRAEIAVQYPDKFRLRAPVLGEELTICRRGQEVWVWPGRKRRR